jgi:hypothetical protein
MANEDRITGFEYVGASPLTEQQYTNSFVNFYNQFLGLPTLEEQTGIETTDPEEITELRQPSASRDEGGRDTSRDIGDFGFRGPEVNTDLSSFTSPHASYADALSASGLQDRVPFVENIVDPIMAGDLSSVEFGKQVGVVLDQKTEQAKGLFSGIDSFEDVKEKVSEKAPIGMAGTLAVMNPFLGATIGGVLTGKTFVNAFGRPSMRPGGPLGAITDFVATRQYSDIAAINAATATGAAQTGFAGLFGNLGITRAPGSGTYTGNMQGMSHTQVKNIEAISKGFVPSTYNMTEETGTSLQEGGYNTGRLATGGYYKENGTYMDPFGRTSAMGLMEDLESLASNYGVSVSQASDALSNARQGNGTLSENLTSSAKGSPRPTDAGEESQRPEPSGGGDDNFRDSGMSRSDFGSAQEAAKGYRGGYGFADGGRVGLAMGGAPQMASGFVDRPPSQVSEGQSVADNVDTSLPEGAFVINAAAVEFAGEQDIRKMLVDANKEAVRRGLTVDKQGNGAKLIDVAISRGEVVVAPHLAKIIGYDRLNKINNRGKPETQERIAENGQQQVGAAEGGFLGGIYDYFFGSPEEPAEQKPDRVPEATPKPAPEEGFLGPQPDVGEDVPMEDYGDIPDDFRNALMEFSSRPRSRTSILNFVKSLPEDQALAFMLMTETIPNKAELNEMEAVAQVAVNRVNSDYRNFKGLTTLQDVLTQQTSKGAPEFAGLDKSTANRILKDIRKGLAEPGLRKAFAAATNVLSGEMEMDPAVSPNTLFYTIPTAQNQWMRDNPDFTFSKMVGPHEFYEVQ